MDVGCEREGALASDEECLLKDAGPRAPPGAPPGASGWQWARVIPVLMLYSISGAPLMSVRSQYMYKKVQEYMNVTLVNSQNASCVVNDSDPNYLLQQRVQAEAANWNMYVSLAHFLPSLLMTVFYGVYSDYLGRRITFILPPIGSMLSTLVTIAMLYFDLPIQFFFLEVVEYLFGGMYTLFMGAFAYIADLCPPEKRATRMTVLDAVLLLCFGVSELFVGYWIKKAGFLPPLYFVMVGKFLTLIYAIFFIPETITRTKPTTTSTKSAQRDQPSGGVSLTQIKHGFLLYLEDNGTGRRWKLNLLLVSYVMAYIISTYSIMTLFEMNTPLCWGSVFIGYFGSAGMGLRCVSTLLGAFILRRKLSEAWIAVVARAQSVAEGVYLAFVSSTTMMFFAPVIGCMSFLATPMTRAMMSKLVKKREQGSMFAVMTCAESFGGLISTLGVNKIYAATLFFMKGFIFLCGAGFSLISLTCILILIWYSGREKKAAERKASSSIQA